MKSSSILNPPCVISCRTRGIFAKLGIPDFDKVHVQVVGAEESFGQNAISVDKCPREVSP